MKINTFEKKVMKIIPKDEDDWLFENSNPLEMWISDDGCFSATYKKKPIQCEGVTWDKALDIIYKFIVEEDNGYNSDE